MDNTAKPKGIRFPTEDSDRILCTDGEWAGWVFEKLEDGRWVSIVKPSADKLVKIAGYCLYHERRDKTEAIWDLRDHLYP